jgi:hypothetical protein
VLYFLAFQDREAAMAALEEEDQIARDRQNEVEFTKSQSVIVSEAKMVE